jgi:Co/Zn/Cd efflux system component
MADRSLRATVATVAGLNLAYFGIEVGVALAIGSVSLLADGIDFLEDAAVNLLILLALGWSLAARARLGMGLAGLMLAPAAATLWMLAIKIASPLPPAPVALTLTGAGALIVNFSCALMLAKHRATGGSLTRAAFLSSRNDVFANIAIIAAGAATLLLHSGWPDIVVGVGIGLLNLDAAREVWSTARGEHREAHA